MFSDFDESAQKEGGGGRKTASLLIALGIFALLGVALAAALAIRHEIQRREEELAVQFAVLDAPEEEPEPEPEPEPEQPPPQRRAPAAAIDGPPTSIPDQRPVEADGELSEAGETGPIGGTVDGVEGGTDIAPPAPVAPPAPEPPPGPPRPPRPPPQQERVEVQAPRRIAGCDTPERPASLEGATAETIRIRVRVVIGPDGRIMRATVTEGHALIPDETLLSCVNTRIYEPATLEGTPVPYVMTYVFTFRPDVL